MRKHTLTLEQALGLPLSHDLTKISVKDNFKGPKFKRGHVVTEADIDILRSMGKNTLTVLELDEGEVHEDEASSRLGRALMGKNTELQGPGEGKCSLFSRIPGLLDLDPNSIDSINLDPDWVTVTLSNHVPVEKNEVLASFRVLPLAVSEDQVKRAEKLAHPISVMAYTKKTIGLITTGKELSEGLIEDAFAPKLQDKIKPYGGSLKAKVTVTDDKNAIAQAIDQMEKEKIDLIICTGGMSVDADDVTPEAIKSSGAAVIFKGIPVLPGCHLMMAKKNASVVIGVPAGAVFEPRTSLDLILPRVFADFLPTQKEVRSWGVGGLCSHCKVCNFPSCAFAAR